MHFNHTALCIGIFSTTLLWVYYYCERTTKAYLLNIFDVKYSYKMFSYNIMKCDVRRKITDIISIKICVKNYIVADNGKNKY